MNRFKFSPDRLVMKQSLCLEKFTGRRRLRRTAKGHRAQQYVPSHYYMMPQASVGIFHVLSITTVDELDCDYGSYSTILRVKLPKHYTERIRRIMKRYKTNCLRRRNQLSEVFMELRNVFETQFDRGCSCSYDCCGHFHGGPNRFRLLNAKEVLVHCGYSRNY